MIIVKEKSKITPLFIMRNDVENTTESGSGQYVTEAELNEQLSLKQDTLVSGANIKTINGDSIVGEGNLEITLGSIIGGAGIDFDNYYTKTEVDELIDNVEVDLTNYYTKSEVNELLENVDADVDLSNYYNKGEVDILIDNSEQDIKDYVGTELNSQLGDYATKTDMAIADNKLQQQIDNLPIPKYTSELINDSDFINSDYLKDYITESELEDIIGGLGGNVPYVVFENIQYTDGFRVVGDLNKVVEAVKNKTPYLAYYHNVTTIYGVYNALYLVDFAKFDVATNSGSFYFHIEGGDNTNKHRTNEIPFTFDGTNYKTGLLKYTIHSYATTAQLDTKQNVLVSGESIKTINGENLLGEGNIEISGGGSGGSNIVSLTQYEYDELVNTGQVNNETMYLITDEAIEANFKTINGESIIGVGNIEITGGDVDLSNYVTFADLDSYTTGEQVDTKINEQIGNINTILENIIG